MTIELVKNLVVPIAISFITGGMALFGVTRTNRNNIRLAKENNKLLKENAEVMKIIEKDKKFIETITIQRIEWLNNIKDKMAQYLSVTNYIGGSKEEKDNRLREAYLYQNHIFFQLNLKEPSVVELFRAMEDHTKKFSILLKNNNSPVDKKIANDEWRSARVETRTLSHAIFKTEWDRIKLEAQGKDLSNADTICQEYRIEYEKVYKKENIV